MDLSNRLSGGEQTIKLFLGWQSEMEVLLVFWRYLSEAAKS